MACLTGAASTALTAAAGGTAADDLNHNRRVLTQLCDIAAKLKAEDCVPTAASISASPTGGGVTRWREPIKVRIVSFSYSHEFTTLLMQLLFVTPEKLASSTTLLRTLRGLACVGMLARFVIDEAHCLVCKPSLFVQCITKGAGLFAV